MTVIIGCWTFDYATYATMSLCLKTMYENG